MDADDEFAEQGMRQAVAKLLVAWRNANGNRLPERLIFYRDGVSEGQFRSVQMLEIPQIRMACEEVMPMSLKFWDSTHNRTGRYDVADKSLAYAYQWAALAQLSRACSCYLA